MACKRTSASSEQDRRFFLKTNHATPVWVRVAETKQTNPKIVQGPSNSQCFSGFSTEKEVAREGPPLVKSKSYLYLRARREHALKRDIEVEGEIRLQVVVGLIAACGRQCLTRQLHIRRRLIKRSSG